jgi:hypothetical protein
LIWGFSGEILGRYKKSLKIKKDVWNLHGMESVVSQENFEDIVTFSSIRDATSGLFCVI